MKRLPFKKINAFATPSSAGNPAGMIQLGSKTDLEPHEMQRIARELKGFVSEVGFVWPEEEDYGLCYYSSEREVEFCGHATIGIMYELISNNEHLRRRPEILIHNRMGTLKVVNRILSENSVYISSPPPVNREQTYTDDQLAEMLSTSSRRLHGQLKPCRINAGLETLVIPFAGLDAVLALSPDIEQVRSFCDNNGINIIACFSEEVASTVNRARIRVFAAPYGYLEDPATGTGNAALGYFLYSNGLWDGTPIQVEQNGDRDNPNHIRMFINSEQDNPAVFFGGAAVTKIDGVYTL